jgi:predicted acetyltransferase
MSVEDAGSAPDRARTLPSDWSLAPATEAERPLLAQLLQLYLHDFSELDHDEVGEDGRFSYRWFDLYGSKPGYQALLLRVRDKPAGFVLLEERGSEDNPDAHYVAEFFVMRAYRRSGYGTAVARALFDRYPGRWEIEQTGPNVAAQVFWRGVIASYTGGRYTEHNKDGGQVVQEFDTADKVEP